MGNPSVNQALGKYQLIAKLGRGGMAEVYLAVARGPVGFNKLQVVKYLREHLAENEDFLNMFLDEARLAALLNHPNIVQTNEVGQDGDTYFIAMEYLEGQTLRGVLSKAREIGMPVSTLMLIRILVDVLTGLQYAHGMVDLQNRPLGIVHRDVSPHNIFLTFDGGIKLVDFGIAKASSSTAETRAGVIKGKVAYMAPEQIGDSVVDRRTDVFQVGVILFEHATGRRYWEGLSEVAILQRIASGQLPTFQPDDHVPAELLRIVAKATALNPDDRYPDAAALREDLERYARTLGTVEPREIGEFVTSLFDDRRRKVRSLIEERLTFLESTPGTSTSGMLNLASTGSYSGWSGNESVPPLGDSSSGSRSSAVIPLASTVRPDVSPASERPSRPRRGWLAIGGVAFVLIAIGGYFGLRNSDAATETPPPIASATTKEVPKEEPAGAPTPAVELITIELSTEPSQAKLFLDDSELPSNPYKSKFPRDGASHRVRAEAQDHKPKTVFVVFDQDRRIEVELERVQTTAPPRPATPRVASTGTEPAHPEPTTPEPKPPPKRTPPKSTVKLDQGDPWK